MNTRWGLVCLLFLGALFFLASPASAYDAGGTAWSIIAPSSGAAVTYSLASGSTLFIRSSSLYGSPPTGTPDYYAGYSCSYYAASLLQGAPVCSWSCLMQSQGTTNVYGDIAVSTSGAQAVALDLQYVGPQTLTFQCSSNVGWTSGYNGFLISTPVSPSPGASPSPALSPSPGVSPSPGASPSPGVSPSPGASPSPDLSASDVYFGQTSDSAETIVSSLNWFLDMSLISTVSFGVLVFILRLVGRL
jgi:hypothetical protein